MYWTGELTDILNGGIDMEDHFRICKTCGKMYRYYNSKYHICYDCLEKEELLFVDAKNYLEEKPGSTVNDLSKELDIPLRLIQRWIQEDRLLFNNKTGFNRCVKCGAEIGGGKICKNCKKKVFNAINQCIEDDKKTNNGDRMRYFRDDW